MTLQQETIAPLSGDQDAQTYFQQLDKIEQGRRLVAEWLKDNYDYHLLTAYIQTRIKYEWEKYLIYKCSQGSPLILLNDQTKEITLLHFSDEVWAPANEVNLIHALEATEQALKHLDQEELQKSDVVDWPPEINGLKTALIEIYLNDQKKDQAENPDGWGQLVGGREVIRLNYVKQYYLSVLQLNGVPEYKTAVEWLRENQPENVTLATLLGDHLHTTLDQMMEIFLNEHPDDQKGLVLLTKGIKGQASKEDWAEMNRCLDQLMQDIPEHLCPTRDELVERWTEAAMESLTGQGKATGWLWDIEDRVR